MKLLKTFLQCLKGSDMFGVSISFLFKKHSAYKTKFGGILTWIVAFLMILALIYTFNSN
jgi:hypothetical protein